MGRVYEAEQNDPRRLFALQVIRASFASAKLLKRFAHEAHVLGRLHHLGIAQIFEAWGRTNEAAKWRAEAAKFVI